jgi:hypothetical protein
MGSSDDTNLWIGYIIGVVVIGSCITIAFRGGENSALQVGLCLAGASIGWLAGIMATPVNEAEKTRFSEMMKAVLAVGSGYVIGKLEDDLVHAARSMIEEDGKLLALRVILFTTCLVVGLLFTLVTRLYGKSAQAKRERHTARLLQNAEKIKRQLDDLKSVV